MPKLPPGSIVTIGPRAAEVTVPARAPGPLAAGSSTDIGHLDSSVWRWQGDSDLQDYRTDDDLLDPRKMQPVTPDRLWSQNPSWRAEDLRAPDQFLDMSEVKHLASTYATPNELDQLRKLISKLDTERTTTRMIAKTKAEAEQHMIRIQRTERACAFKMSDLKTDISELCQHWMNIGVGREESPSSKRRKTMHHGPLALTDEVEAEAKDVVAEADAKDESIRAEASKDGEAKTDAGTKAAGKAEGRQAA